MSRQIAQRKSKETRNDRESVDQKGQKSKRLLSEAIILAQQKSHDPRCSCENCSGKETAIDNLLNHPRDETLRDKHFDSCECPSNRNSEILDRLLDELGIGKK